MRLLHISGKEVDINATKYFINWNKKSEKFSKSIFQTNVKDFFEPFWSCDYCVEEFPVLGSRLKCDLINFTRRYAVESDGNFHDKFSLFFHKNRINYLKSVKRDLIKEKWLELNSIFLIRIKEKDYRNLSIEWIKDNFGVNILNTYGRKRI